MRPAEAEGEAAAEAEAEAAYRESRRLLRVVFPVRRTTSAEVAQDIGSVVWSQAARKFNPCATKVRADSSSLRQRCEPEPVLEPAGVSSGLLTITPLAAICPSNPLWPAASRFGRSARRPDGLAEQLAAIAAKKALQSEAPWASPEPRWPAVARLTILACDVLKAADCVTTSY